MNFKRITASLLALLVIVGMVAGGAIAAFDTETSTTATTSDVSGASNTVTAYWGNSSQTLYTEIQNSSTSNLTLELSPAQAGVDYVAYSNASPVETDATNGHYAWNVSYDELDVPRDADGGTYNLTVVNDSGGVVEETEVTFQTDASANQDSVVAVTDGAGTDAAALSNLVADRLTIENKADNGFWSGFGIWGSDNGTDVATFSAYTTVNSSSSDVTVKLANQSTADAYAAAAEDYEDGEWIKGMTVYVDGEPKKVYKGSTPDGENSSAVYSKSSDTLTVSLDQNKTIRTVSVRSTAGEKFGFWELQEAFGWGQAFSLWA